VHIIDVVTVSLGLYHAIWKRMLAQPHQFKIITKSFIIISYFIFSFVSKDFAFVALLHAWICALTVSFEY
jgi:hypothetical protein